MKRWTIEQANQWYQKQPWLVGCNFIPSTAINQLEMWQTATYDPATIDRELGWAAQIGFNTIRVFLHDLVWLADANGFAKRIDDFLGIAQRHSLKTMLVLFDNCHRPDPVSGLQPLPVRGVHNSGWQQSPSQKLVRQFHDGTVAGTETARLRDYVTGVLTRFADDDRILLWDLYNEPRPTGPDDQRIELLTVTWQWARSVRVGQPLTSCLDGGGGEEVQMINGNESDVITFHNYSDAQALETVIGVHTKKYAGRPLICTEYMARSSGSTFQSCLPIFKKFGVGCYNWGLVVGKTQTHFDWTTIAKLPELRAQGAVLRLGDSIPEPALWFHDIFRSDGTAFDPAEPAFIRGITK